MHEKNISRQHHFAFCIQWNSPLGVLDNSLFDYILHAIENIFIDDFQFFHQWWRWPSGKQVSAVQITFQDTINWIALKFTVLMGSQSFFVQKTPPDDVNHSLLLSFLGKSSQLFRLLPALLQVYSVLTPFCQLFRFLLFYSHMALDCPVYWPSNVNCCILVSPLACQHRM